VILPQFIDIHTHKTGQAPKGELRILNIHENFSQLDKQCLYSFGLHPWYLDNHEINFLALKEFATAANVAAIGECGLDRVCSTDWSVQKSVFAQQLELAEALSKPVIIHCVRAYEDVLSMLEGVKKPNSVVFHGFNRNVQLARKIVSRGHYLSFGAGILKNSSVQKAFNLTPMEKIFFETDNSDIQINRIYEKAAEIKDTSIEDIILQVQQNFDKVFIVV